MFVASQAYPPIYAPSEKLSRDCRTTLQKRRKVQHSVISDSNSREYAALVVSERYVLGRYVLGMDEKARTSPMGSQSWTAIMQSQRHDGR